MGATIEPPLSLNTDVSGFLLFFKSPICYLTESIQPYSDWKLILGASFKGLLLDFLIKIQTLQGQSRSRVTGDRQSRSEQLSCPTAPGRPTSLPLCTSSSTKSSRTSSWRGSKGVQILYLLAWQEELKSEVMATRAPYPEGWKEHCSLWTL